VQSQSLNITRKKAKAFIDDYLASFPGVKQYMSDIVKDARSAKPLKLKFLLLISGIYLRRCNNVSTYPSAFASLTKADGYVETLLHRRRYIPDINSRNFNLRGFAERTAMKVITEHDKTFV
jgi:DNA polymerase-1